MIQHILLFVTGVVALSVGADWLVRGSSRVAGAFGISPLVVGLTVVAFGTSAPELVVTGAAALRGQPGLAVGNVMGSTVANVGLIVGVGALIRPIGVHRRVLVREGPLLILVLATVVVLSLNNALGRLDGAALVVGFSVYLVFLLRWARERAGEPGGQGGEGEDTDPAGWGSWARVVLGLAALPVGAHLLVEEATVLARAFDVPEAVIGATMVAVGTSLPELASTIAAAARGMGDIAVGNVIGSNVFNLGLVLGSAALLRPLVLPPRTVVLQVLPALIFSIAILPLGYTGDRISRGEGLLLLLGYGYFLYWIL